MPACGEGGLVQEGEGQTASAPRQVERELRRAADSPAMHGLARAGLAASGVIYLLIGGLAVRVALGRGGRADRSGALEAVARTPGGKGVLWLLAAGFAGLALWRFAEALYGQPTSGGGKPGMRLAALFRGLLYVAFCVTTIAFVTGAGGGASSDTESKDLTGKAMHAVPGGRWIVTLVGVGFVVGGIIVIVQALKRRFMGVLDTAAMGPRTRRTVGAVGVVGRLARGTVFAAVGGFLAYSGLTFDPQKAQGVDGTLREFANTPVGPWLLVVVALGLVTFGLYAFCEARWHRL